MQPYRCNQKHTIKYMKKVEHRRQTRPAGPLRNQNIFLYFNILYRMRLKDPLRGQGLLLKRKQRILQKNEGTAPPTIPIHAYAANSFFSSLLPQAESDVHRFSSDPVPAGRARRAGRNRIICRRGASVVPCPRRAGKSGDHHAPSPGTEHKGRSGGKSRPPAGSRPCRHNGCAS